MVYSAVSHQSWLLWMPEKTVCLKTQDCSEDYGLNPSRDIVEPWGNRWQQQEKSHYDEIVRYMSSSSIVHVQCRIYL